MYIIILIFWVWFLLPKVMSRRFIHVIPYKLSSSFSTAPQNEYTTVYLSILPLMHVVFIYFGATVNILLCMHVSFDGYKNLFFFSLMCSKAYMFLISTNIAKNPFLSSFTNLHSNQQSNTVLFVLALFIFSVFFIRTILRVPSCSFNFYFPEDFRVDLFRYPIL